MIKNLATFKHTSEKLKFQKCPPQQQQQKEEEQHRVCLDLTASPQIKIVPRQQGFILLIPMCRVWSLTCANLTQSRASSSALYIRISSSAQYYPKLGIDTGLSLPSGLKVRSRGARARAWESRARAVYICIAAHILVKQMKVPPYLVVFGLGSAGPDPAYPTPSCVVPARGKRKKNPPRV